MSALRGPVTTRALAAAVALLSLAGPWLAPAVSARASGPPAEARPSTQTIRPPYRVAPVARSGKKVLAHYFPPYPISLDNRPPAQDYYTRHYLNPNGEKGKFRAVGGLLRDRPVPRPPIRGDYLLADAITEVRQASAAGIDGFTIDILDWSGRLWDQTVRMGVAAQRVGNGFVTVPNIDLASDADDTPVPVIAGKLAQLYRQRSAYRLADGRYVLSSFKAEARPVAWWQSLFRELQVRHGVRVAFVGVFLDLTPARITAYAPISYAMSIWGLRTVTSIRRSPDKAGPVHRAGVKWMAPVAVQDVRHRSLIYAEASNTATLRASWRRALTDRADLVQLITWNDYSESTHFAPSRAHGRAFLDVNGLYVTRFKRGGYPAITGDQLVVTHRIMRHGARPTVQRTTMRATLSGTSVRPRDTVEVLAMLRAPARVTLRVGARSYAYTLPKGLSARVVPLGYGAVSATAVREGRRVAIVSSPRQVVARVPYYDLQYYGAASGP